MLPRRPLQASHADLDPEPPTLHAQGGISTQTDAAITGWTDEESSQADASLPSSPASTVRPRSAPLSDSLQTARSLDSARSLALSSPRSPRRAASGVPAPDELKLDKAEDLGPVREPASWLAARDPGQGNEDVLQTLLAASATLLALEVGGQKSQARPPTQACNMHAAACGWQMHACMACIQPWESAAGRTSLPARPALAWQALCKAMLGCCMHGLLELGQLLTGGMWPVQARLQSMNSSLVAQPSLLTASSYIPGRGNSLQSGPSLDRRGSLIRGQSGLPSQDSAALGRRGSILRGQSGLPRQESSVLGLGGSIMRGLSRLAGQEQAITMEELEALPEEPEEQWQTLPQGFSLLGAPSLLQQQASKNVADEAYTFRIVTAAAADLQRIADQQDPRVRGLWRVSAAAAWHASM